MNKLNPQDLHLLLDEPIYLLNDHNVMRELSEDESKREEPSDSIDKSQEIRDILVVFDEKISADDETFLFKGLNALNIAKEDVTIIYQEDFEQLKPSKGYTKLLHFVTNPVEVNLYNNIEVSGYNHLECHSLSLIQNDQELKVKFWLGLKAMFAK